MSRACADPVLPVTFRLVDFNPRRHMRGAEGARVEVREDGEFVGLLWMSREDVVLNLAEYPGDAGLEAALAAYGTPSQEIRDGQPYVRPVPVAPSCP